MADRRWQILESVLQNIRPTLALDIDIYTHITSLKTNAHARRFTALLHALAFMSTFSRRKAWAGITIGAPCFYDHGYQRNNDYYDDV
jgi:hypothetical protein